MAIADLRFADHIFVICNLRTQLFFVDLKFPQIPTLCSPWVLLVYPPALSMGVTLSSGSTSLLCLWVSHCPMGLPTCSAYGCHIVLWVYPPALSMGVTLSSGSTHLLCLCVLPCPLGLPACSVYVYYLVLWVYQHALSMCITLFSGSTRLLCLWVLPCPLGLPACSVYGCYLVLWVNPPALSMCITLSSGSTRLLCLWVLPCPLGQPACSVYVYYLVLWVYPLALSMGVTLSSGSTRSMGLSPSSVRAFLSAPREIRNLRRMPTTSNHCTVLISFFAKMRKYPVIIPLWKSSISSPKLQSFISISQPFYSLLRQPLPDLVKYLRLQKIQFLNFASFRNSHGNRFCG